MFVCLLVVLVHLNLCSSSVVVVQWDNSRVDRSEVVGSNLAWVLLDSSLVLAGPYEEKKIGFLCQEEISC